MSEAAKGHLAAAGALSKTVLHPDVGRVLETYRRLDSEEAKARYADHFLGRTAHFMDEIWPTFYELLKRVEDGELYRKPGYLGGDKVFDSFKDYWEYRVGQPFEHWAELESTYQYAATFRRDLFRKTFTVARNMKERAVQKAQKLARAIKEEGLVINEGDGRPSREEASNPDIIRVSPRDAFGTNAEYLARRIARDHPDVLDRMAAGEFPSVIKAAIAAGIAPRTQTIRIDDPESVARTLRKHMPREALARLIELLTKEDQ